MVPPTLLDTFPQRLVSCPETREESVSFQRISSMKFIVEVSKNKSWFSPGFPVLISEDLYFLEVKSFTQSFQIPVGEFCFPSQFPFPISQHPPLHQGITRVPLRHVDDQDASFLEHSCLLQSGRERIFEVFHEPLAVDEVKAPGLDGEVMRIGDEVHGAILESFRHVSADRDAIQGKVSAETAAPFHRDTEHVQIDGSAASNLENGGKPKTCKDLSQLVIEF
jgi:hypothetical protein